MRSKITQLLHDWREGGATHVGKRLLYYAHIPFINLVILGCIEPAPAIAEDTEPPVGYIFARGRDTDVEEIARCEGDTPETYAHFLKLFQHFFSAGHRCVIVRAQNRVIGHIWGFSGEYVITVDDYRHTRLAVTLDAVSVFTGNAYIAPEHRSRGIFRQLKRYLMHQYPLGTHFYTWVNELNDPSYSANRALGFKRLALLRFAGPIGRVRLSFRETGADAWTRLRRPWPTLRIAGKRIKIDGGA